MKGRLCCAPGWGGAALLLLSESACEPVRERHESSLSAVVNGQDDRREVFDLESTEQRTVLEGGVAALMWAHRIDVQRPSALRATSAGQALGLCDDERFAEQPSAAFCTATLIDDDLVLTAGHCLGHGAAEAAERCQRLWVVFDYHYRYPNHLALGSASDVFACRRVVYHQHASREQSFVDVAVLQLDRPVSSDRARVTIASQPPRVGDELLAASHGVGLPLKVDRGGSVLEIPERAEHFLASTDSFVGGSGSPLFNASLALVAFQVRGARDWIDDGSCVRAAHAEKPGEQHQLVHVAVDALCASEWPSAALCAKVPRCGDQVCNGNETREGCAEDCPQPHCGDGLCELGERASCEQDCAQYLQVPPAWSDDPAHYDEAEPVSDAPSALQARGGCSVHPASTRGTGSIPGALLILLVLRPRARRRAKSRCHRGEYR